MIVPPTKGVGNSNHNTHWLPLKRKTHFFDDLKSDGSPVKWSLFCSNRCDFICDGGKSNQKIELYPFGKPPAHSFKPPKLHFQANQFEKKKIYTFVTAYFE